MSLNSRCPPPFLYEFGVMAIGLHTGFEQISYCGSWVVGGKGVFRGSFLFSADGHTAGEDEASIHERVVACPPFFALLRSIFKRRYVCLTLMA